MNVYDQDDEANYQARLEREVDSLMIGDDVEFSSMDEEEPEEFDLYRNSNYMSEVIVAPLDEKQILLRNAVYDNDLVKTKGLLEKGIDPNSVPGIFEFRLDSSMYDLLFEYGLNPYSEYVKTYEMWPFRNKIKYKTQIEIRKRFVQRFKDIIRQYFDEYATERIVDKMNLVFKFKRCPPAPVIYEAIDAREEDKEIYADFKKLVFKTSRENGKFKTTSQLTEDISKGSFSKVKFVVDYKDNLDIDKFLKYAMFYEHPRLVEYFVDKKASINDHDMIIRYICNVKDERSSRRILPRILNLRSKYLSDTSMIEKFIRNGLNVRLSKSIYRNTYGMYTSLLKTVSEVGLRTIHPFVSKGVLKRINEDQDLRREKFIEERTELYSSLLDLDEELSRRIVEVSIFSNDEISRSKNEYSRYNTG